MAEQRQEPRLQQAMDVTVVVKSAPDCPHLEGRVFTSHSVDVSSGGLQLDSDVPFSVGTKVELNILSERSPTGYWQCGYVVWDIKPMHDFSGSQAMHRIGIQFSSTENSQLHAWHALLCDLFERNMMVRPG